MICHATHRCRGGALRSVFAAGFIFCVLPSCSVREDRSSCPCVLVLRMAGAEAPQVAVSVVAGESFSHYSRPEAPFPEEYPVEVPRQLLHADVTFPASAGEPGGGVTIPYGEPCPELWSWNENFEALGDYVVKDVVLHKNFCRIVVKVSSFDGSQLYPFSLLARGGVCGSLPGGASKAGAFEAAFVPSDERGIELPGGGQTGCWSVRVPRQTDESLLLDITFGDDVLRTFALGAFMAEAGYDWTAPDLEDAFIDIDYARTTVTVRSDLWKDVQWTFEKVI